MTGPSYKSDDVVVFDDVLPAGQFAALLRHLNGLDYTSVHARGWRKVWRLHDGSPLTGRAGWYRPHDDPDEREILYPTGSPIDDLITWILDRLPDLETVVGAPDTWDRMSFAPWIYPPGSGLSLHQDGVLYTGAFTYYAHPQWQLHWGGYLVVLDPRTRPVDISAGELSPPFLTDAQESRRAFDPGIGLTVLPKPNRIAFLSPTALHLMTRVDQNAGQAARISVAGFFHKRVTPPAPR